MFASIGNAGDKKYYKEVLMNPVDYITPVDSGLSATQWGFSDPTTIYRKKK